MPKPQREEAESLPEYEHEKLKRLYTQGGAVFGSVQNLVKAKRLSISKVRQFLNSKHSYTEVNIATGYFEKFDPFARFKSKFCRMQLAYADKPAQDEKYLLVRHGLFD